MSDELIRSLRGRCKTSEARAEALRAAINHALETPDGLEWLRAWNEGDPEAMRDLDKKMETRE